MSKYKLTVPWYVAAWRCAWIIPFTVLLAGCYLCLLAAWGLDEANRFWMEAQG